MARTSQVQFPWGTATKKAVNSKQAKSPLIYYGGKGDGEWIVSNLPPGWKTCVDLFGGGGSVTFRLALTCGRSKTLVYNDLGNVANFMRMLRDHGEEIYKRLYLTPWSREDFEQSRSWPDYWIKAVQSGLWEDYVEWACQWYVHLMIGFTHEERPGSTGFKVSKTTNAAATFYDRIDEIPFFVDLIRSGITIEKGDAIDGDIISTYDSPETLFYSDPPYTADSRASLDNYLRELPREKQSKLLHLLQKVKGQVVLSGYHNDLYDTTLTGWRVVEKTAVSGIVNSKQQTDRGSRTEVLWIKEHAHGLWS